MSDETGEGPKINIPEQSINQSKPESQNIMPRGDIIDTRGKSPEELIQMLKDMARKNNQMPDASTNLLGHEAGTYGHAQTALNQLNQFTENPDAYEKNEQQGIKRELINKIQKYINQGVLPKNILDRWIDSTDSYEQFLNSTPVNIDAESSEKK